MRRRGVGIGAIQKEKLAKQKLAAKGEELQEANLQEMSKQMDKFRDNLEKFAVSHKKDIQKDPEFRRHFQVRDFIVFLANLVSFALSRQSQNGKFHWLDSQEKNGNKVLFETVVFLGNVCIDWSGSTRIL